jgi:glycosidase
MMKKIMSDSFHRAALPFQYVVDAKTLVVTLRTPKEQIVAVTVLHVDPFKRESEADFSAEPMRRHGSDAEFDYWRASLRPAFRRVRYGFRLTDAHQTVEYLTEMGLQSTPIWTSDHLFCKPFIHATDCHRPPQWVKNAVWYQIFPERFARGPTYRGSYPEPVPDWGSTAPTPSNFFGGNLEGILARIPYLKELGVTALYLTPIFEATTNHKYDTTDYFRLDPQFGTPEIFRALVQSLHANGIRIMLDAVFNHCGQLFAPFQDVLRHQENSRYKDWFHIHSFPIRPDVRPLTYDTYAFESHMPKLNTGNPEVRDYLIRVGRYWIEEFGIDGWRLDVSNEIDHEFWRDFRRTLRAIQPDLFILGEIWHDSLPWLHGDQFDSVMNYPLNAISTAFVRGQLAPAAFRAAATRLLHMYPDTVNQVLFNLIGSHDTERILTTLKGDKKLLKMLAAIEFSFVGTPCIYYGDEIGMTGKMDPGCRECMKWDSDDQDLDLKSFYQRLITVRRSNSAFSSMSLEFVDLPEDPNHELVAFMRYDQDQRVLVILNNTWKDVTLSSVSFARNLWTDPTPTAKMDATLYNPTSSLAHARHKIQIPSQAFVMLELTP